MICSVLCLVTHSCPTLCNPLDCILPDSSAHGHSPGKNTGMGWHVLLQRIFPTQGLNPGLLHCRWILYCLSHQGSPINMINILNSFQENVCCMPGSMMDPELQRWVRQGRCPSATETCQPCWLISVVLNTQTYCWPESYLNILHFAEYFSLMLSLVEPSLKTSSFPVIILSQKS